MEARERQGPTKEIEVKGYLLDTHVWIWVQLRFAEELSSGFFKEIDAWQREKHLYISDASVWEAARLATESYVNLAGSVDDFVEEAMRDDGLHLLPVSTRIFMEATRLPGEIHRDPLDRLLVATAREHNLTLVTRDKQILRYAKEGHLKARKP
jgi:PIN domain nuclease of toxin-antitoxin system